MVGIVVDNHFAVFAGLFEPELEAALWSEECAYGIAHHVVGHAYQLAYCHCCHCVLDVDVDRHAEFDVFDCAFGAYEVKHDFAVALAHVFCVEVAFVARVVVDGDALLWAWTQFQSGVADECAAGLD